MAESPPSSASAAMSRLIIPVLLFSLLYAACEGRWRRPSVAAVPLCDPFVGQWLPDPTSRPPYLFSSCQAIDPQFNCQLYGRKDTGYLRYTWKPDGCDLPDFDGLDFLQRMRGKNVMFVGDSLGRNQWESLICLLIAASQPPAPLPELIRGDPLSTCMFLEYEMSISFYRAPFLVDIDEMDGKRILTLDDISINGQTWAAADILFFNSGHWWTHIGDLQGWDYIRFDGAYYYDMDRTMAFQKALSTWAQWVDFNINSTKTKIFFQSLSPTHYNPMEWKHPASKNCYGETTPVRGWNYTGGDSVAGRMIQVIRGVLDSMRTPAYFSNIARLSELRKDGHPSVYSGVISPQQRTNPDRFADCSHWCLPGLPDTWNQLFYAALFY